MTENLHLQNPGFEGLSRPGGWTRDTHTGQEYGEIFTAEGWTTFWEEGIYRRPEVKVIPKQAPFLDPPRIHQGDWAVQMFTYYGRMHAGLYQVVAGLAPGKVYEFSIQAHAWSTTPGLEGEHDAHCSAGVGCGPVYILPEDVPPLSGDPSNDAIGNFTFQVGVSLGDKPDPFNGVNWCDGACIYNGYHKVPPIRFIAPQDGKIVVYVKATSLWQFRNSDIYLDNAELIAIDEPPPYESTMLVLPQDATPGQLQEIFTLAFPDRRSFGWSHDDAGNLNGTAVLYNIPANEKNAYLGFYVTRYPNVTVEFAYTNDWVDPPSELLLKQCDPRWGDEKIAGPDCSKTLCQTGCWVSDAAMAQRYFDIKDDATPHTANQALGAIGGFSGCNTKWSAMKTALGLEVFERHYDDQRARDWLDGGYVCFAEVEPADFTHFILITKYSEGRFWMLDPYKGIEGWVDEHYPGIESWRSICPFESPAPPVKGSLVSLHLQSMVDGVLAPNDVAALRCFEPGRYLPGDLGEYVSHYQETLEATLGFVERVKPQVIKIFQLEVAKEIKARSPDTAVVLRYYTEHQDWMVADKMGAARDYVRSFQDSLAVNAEWIDLVESWNETVCSNNEESIRNAVEFDCCFADALAETGLPVGPQLLNVAVGNPLESEVELLLPAVEQAIKYAGTLGYHCFSADTEVLTEGGWLLLSEIVEETLPVRLATLNQATGEVEYQLPTDYFVYDHVGPMVHVDGKVDVLVTPNHRMWIRNQYEGQQHHDSPHQGFKFVEAKDLPSSFETRRDLGQYQGIEKESFDLPAYSKEWTWGGQPFKIYRPTLAIPMEAWLAFFGLWITEGHVSKNAVGLSQNPGKTLDSIIEAIEGCGFEYSVYDHKNRTIKRVNILQPAQLESYLRQFGKAKDKFIPRWMLSLSQQQLRILFGAMMAGDGSWGHSPYFCTASSQLADDFQELALKVGYATMLSQHCDGYFYVSLAAERKTPRTRPPYVNTIEYEGKIYCVSVPNGLVFMRRNGKPSWQGNSYGFAPNKGNLNDAWQYYAGRALEGWDPVFRAHGLYPMYVFGECGAFATCNDGWRAANCLGGDWVLYLAQLIEFSDRIKAWNAQHSNRCLGGTLFTSGGWGWDSWEITKSEMEDPNWPL